MKLAGGDWSRGDLIAIASLAVTIVGCIAAVLSIPPPVPKPDHSAAIYSGKVTSEDDDNNAIGGAMITVTVAGTSPSYTDSTGAFSIKVASSPEPVKLRVQAEHYHTFELLLGEDRRLEIRLKPADGHPSAPDELAPPHVRLPKVALPPQESPPRPDVSSGAKTSAIAEDKAAQDKAAQEKAVRDLEAEMNSAVPLFASGKYGEAITHYSTAIDSWDQQSLPPTPEYNSAYYWRGEAYARLVMNKRGDPDLEKHAREDLGRAVASFTAGDPRIPQAWFDICYVDLDAGDNSRAIQDCQNGIDAHPPQLQLAHFYNNLGAAYSRAGQPDRGADDYRLAIQYSPYDKPLIALAEWELKKGQRDQAISHLKQALDAPGDSAQQDKAHAVEILRKLGVTVQLPKQAAR